MLPISFILLLASCQTHPKSVPPNPLAERFRPKPIVAGPRDVVMSIVFVERPFGDRLLNGDAWDFSDDQQWDLALRNELDEQGFRVAVLGGQIPAVLESMVKEESQGPNGEVLQMQSGTPTQINVSDPHPTWPTDLGAHPDGAEGSYDEAVSSLRIVPTILRDGRVDVSITPEIHHGAPVRRFVHKDQQFGAMNWSFEVGKEIHPLDDLTFSVALQPGQMVLLSCTPSRRDSLGAFFFGRRKSGHSKQRLIIIGAEAPGAVDGETPEPL